MSFTFKGYATILDAFKHFGYHTVTFKEFDPENEYQLLIRHDVDYYPNNCLKLAEIEQKYGFISTFFFLLTSRFYNPLSNYLQHLFINLHSKGFHLGLHYDSEAYKNDFHQYIVRQIFDNEFDVYSNHKPRTQGMKKYDGMHILSTYAKKFAWDSKYLTDSNREWKYGHPVDWLEEWGDTGKNVQLLIHPIWYHENEKNRKHCYLTLQANATNLIAQLLDKDEKDYAKEKNEK